MGTVFGEIRTAKFRRRTNPNSSSFHLGELFLRDLGTFGDPGGFLFADLNKGHVFSLRTMVTSGGADSGVKHRRVIFGVSEEEGGQGGGVFKAFPKQRQFLHFLTRPDFGDVSFNGGTVAKLLFDFGEGDQLRPGILIPVFQPQGGDPSAVLFLRALGEGRGVGRFARFRVSRPTGRGTLRALFTLSCRNPSPPTILINTVGVSFPVLDVIVGGGFVFFFLVFSFFWMVPEPFAEGNQARNPRNCPD